MEKVARVICVLIDAANTNIFSNPEIKVPTLNALRKDGLFVHSKTVLPSDSRSARHAAFSGSYPSISGILSNNPSETVFDVAYEYGFKTIISGGWEGDAYSLDSRNIVTYTHYPKTDTISEMCSVKEMRGEYTSSYVVDRALGFIEESPDFKILFTDFLDSDCVGHRFKETSREYRQALEYEDRQLNRLIMEFEIKGLLEDSLLIVFTDHAMVNSTHGGIDALDTWIILHGNSIEKGIKGKETIGTILDICPTICNVLDMRLPNRCRAISLIQRMKQN
jgi:predicted AlkP superfamily pyrophosphatase or phosphodiesterase